MGLPIICAGAICLTMYYRIYLVYQLTFTAEILSFRCLLVNDVGCGRRPRI